MNEQTRRVNEMLYAKMESEYYFFLDELEKKEPKEIIASSYEKVFKEDILLVFQENELTYDRAKALLRMEHPLDAAYRAWLKDDVSYMEMLTDSVEYFAKRECERQRKERDAR